MHFEPNDDFVVGHRRYEHLTPCETVVSWAQAKRAVSVTLSVHPWVRLFAWLVPRIRRHLRPVAAGERHQKVFFVDELLARVVGRRMNAGVHPNRIAGTGLDTKSAKNATELVDDEPNRKPLVSATSI